MERWAGHWMSLMHSIIRNPSLALASAELLSEQDKKQVIEQFNDTRTEFLQGVTIHRLFEEQAERTPER